MAFIKNIYIIKALEIRGYVLYRQKEKAAIVVTIAAFDYCLINVFSCNY